jgi:uncharacterized radical SAM superfamily Fe-S cluster-containing enzyme
MTATLIKLRQSYPARGARLLAGFVRKKPVHAIIQVSNRCNLTCSFCSFWANPAKPEHELTLSHMETISDKLAEAGSLVISIEGGEPLMRPDITGIVAAFAKHHHPILFTNGWRVTEDLARQLWAAGLDTIGVSIDYPDADRHDRHRGKPGTLDAACRALDILRATAPRGARQVFVMSVLMEDNIADFEALRNCRNATVSAIKPRCCQLAARCGTIAPPRFRLLALVPSCSRSSNDIHTLSALAATSRASIPTCPATSAAAASPANGF